MNSHSIVRHHGRVLSMTYTLVLAISEDHYLELPCYLSLLIPSVAAAPAYRYILFVHRTIICGVKRTKTNRTSLDRHIPEVGLKRSVWQCHPSVIQRTHFQPTNAMKGTMTCTSRRRLQGASSGSRPQNGVCLLVERLSAGSGRWST